MTTDALSGRSIVVTRPVSAGPALQRKLAAMGAKAISIPVTEEHRPPGGVGPVGIAIRQAVAGDTIAITSAASSRVVTGFARPAPGVTVAVVGYATANALEREGWPADLIPDRHTAVDLAAALGRPTGTGRVIYIAAADPRPEFAARMRTAGWTVDHVVAYKTAARLPEPGEIEAVGSADAIVFTAGSTVDGWCAAATLEQTPPVVTIGPSTTRSAIDAGLTVSAEAKDQSLDGVVAALVELFDRG